MVELPSTRQARLCLAHHEPSVGYRVEGDLGRLAAVYTSAEHRLAHVKINFDSVLDGGGEEHADEGADG